MHESFGNAELPEGNNTAVFFSRQLCNEGSVGMKISFLSWSRCSKRSAGISFYIFCHDPGVVNVVSAGIKICFFVIITL